ncbi:hypothetical protein [Halodesulfovibrio spirochaetisodalis]|uniref:Uncharacterized protein n=1 Tax=Halodesulfovibrio spirochaetisodalis TaxID=1560234 RepID=A0A1B7XJL3_9BACT|nr:hypothetical protein [Halodesulfovibrio spirochaetisodalis]OBQ55693.1 hypothetical protein SP90_03435 [Halodesulfovibrio spirochaetisodalis]
MVQPATSNSPKNWNDLWEPQNKERWEKKASARINCTGNETVDCAATKPMDWDMWQPSKKR